MLCRRILPMTGRRLVADFLPRAIRAFYGSQSRLSWFGWRLSAGCRPKRALPPLAAAPVEWGDGRSAARTSSIWTSRLALLGGDVWPGDGAYSVVDLASRSRSRLVSSVDDGDGGSDCGHNWDDFQIAAWVRNMGRDNLYRLGSSLVNPCIIDRGCHSPSAMMPKN